jgi:hypothetical protein
VSLAAWGTTPGGLARQAADKQIDALMYQLYGLTKEEIKVVEGEG